MQSQRTNEEILSILSLAWNSKPSLRLCQLIYNAVRDDLSQSSLYDYEDDDLVDRLIVYCRLNVPSPGSESLDELARD